MGITTVTAGCHLSQHGGSQALPRIGPLCDATDSAPRKDGCGTNVAQTPARCVPLRSRLLLSHPLWGSASQGATDPGAGKTKPMARPPPARLSLRYATSRKYLRRLAGVRRVRGAAPSTWAGSRFPQPVTGGAQATALPTRVWSLPLCRPGLLGRRTRATAGPRLHPFGLQRGVAATTRPGYNRRTAKSASALVTSRGSSPCILAGS